MYLQVNFNVRGSERARCCGRLSLRKGGEEEEEEGHFRSTFQDAMVKAEESSCAGQHHHTCCSALLCPLQNIERLCCGMMFDTRGAKRAAGIKLAESSTELLLASQMGKLPIGALSCGRLDKSHNDSTAACASPLQPAACAAQLHSCT